MKTLRLFWAPTGQFLEAVRARTMRSAIRKVSAPYCRYLGEVYAEEA